MPKLKSSWIEDATYDASTRVLTIHQKGKDGAPGKTMRLKDVPAEHHQGMLKADSPGQYFNTHVRGKFKPVEEPPPVEEEEKPADSAGKNQGNALSDQGKGDAGGIVTMIDIYPKYPGGDDARLWFLRKNVKYPETAMKSNTQGVIVVVFVIEVDGSISNIEVTKAIGGGCDEEAVRVVKLMPRWEAARRNGKAVRVVVRMPIVFKIPGK